jgi:hypothetical protein
MGLPRPVFTGMLPGRVVMIHRSRMLAALSAALTLVPVLAAGRPACCATPPSAAKHRCCLSSTGASAGHAQGCCNTPAAPAPERGLRHDTGAALSSAPPAMGAPVVAIAALPAAVEARAACAAHRAVAPDDSPPDLLSRLHVLLI